MEILVNKWDREVQFDDLEKAKVYYNVDIPGKENFLGEENKYNDYVEQIKEYKKNIKDSNSLEELSKVLNRYPDFSNGDFEVKEY